MKKLIATIIAAVYVLLLTAMPAFAAPSTVTASVTVNKMCGLDLNNFAVDFGAMDQGDTDVSANTVMATLSSNTNTLTTVTIGGTDWCTGTCPTTPSMLVGQTGYKLAANVTYTSLVAVATPATLFSSSTPDHSETTTFQLTIPSVQPAESYSQTITYDFSCPED